MIPCALLAYEYVCLVNQERVVPCSAYDLGKLLLTAVFSYVFVSISQL